MCIECKMKCLSVLLLILALNSASSNPVSTTESLVVATSEATKENSPDASTSLSPSINPEIYSMQLRSNVSNRFATTLITSKVRNLKNSSEETSFSVILPDNAFISAFEMEIDDKVYKAYVKEKEEAKKIYQEAVSRGQSAAHVELSARDSKTFTTSVNIEPHSKTIFRLTYEELLQRQIGQYELVINIHPGQPVKNLNVEVYINESRPLTFVRTPSLRTGNEISKNDEKLNPSADIQIVNSTSATVRFNPDVQHQNEFARLLGSSKENGLAGQFVVQYDVERDPHGGEILVRDGYFVHFFAPSELQPLKKHVVFVLDHSGSMSGRKFEQLVEAMQHILSELKSDDVFNIVRFSWEASVWNSEQNNFTRVSTEGVTYGKWENSLREMNLPEAVEASAENVEKAKRLDDQSGMSSTNIIAGLEIGLFLTTRQQEKTLKKYQPMIVFLTDGQPNAGIGSTDEIISITTKLNKNHVSIYSLSFGYGADKDFLRKLSSKNLGFSRHIYEAADASLQLQDFYRQISSPVLSNVRFKYVDGVTALTRLRHPLFFNGSEIVIAGRTTDNSNVLDRVTAICTSGPSEFRANHTESASSLERLWAYLTIKDLLKRGESAENGTQSTQEALALALKYSFVTSVSSLVVVKPNDTHGGPSEANTGVTNGAPRFALHRSYAKAGPPTPQFSGAPFAAMPGVGYMIPPQFPRRQFIRFGSGGYPSGGWYNSPGTTIRTHHLSVQITSTPLPPYSAIPTTRTSYYLKMYALNLIPQWLLDLNNNNGNITTAQGSFKLGQSGVVRSHPPCPKTPLNSTGECTIIYDCPKVFSFITDVNVYLQYFCPLNEYAGVCCPPLPRIRF